MRFKSIKPCKHTLIGKRTLYTTLRSLIWHLRSLVKTRKTPSPMYTKALTNIDLNMGHVTVV
jgi:hypothetical protein